MHEQSLQGLKHYCGNTTFCHSQALFTAFYPGKDYKALCMFENYTTVPFGIVHVPNDYYRIIDSYIDPDSGLDRALDTLDIPYEVHYWPKGESSNASEAFSLLRAWSDLGPVVLGPLNMGDLKYYYHRNLYQNIDHYIIVTGVDGETFQVCDTEGFILSYISENDLFNAWRGDHIPEGRGGFVMRKVEDLKNLSYNKENLLRTFKLSVENLASARKMNLGGGNALRSITELAAEIEKNASLRKGITYAIPTRIQRNMFIKEFINMMSISNFNPALMSKWQELRSIIDQQIKLYGKVLAGLIENIIGNLKLLDHVASSEDRFADIAIEIKDEL